MAFRSNNDCKIDRSKTRSKVYLTDTGNNEM